MSPRPEVSAIAGRTAEHLRRSFGASSTSTSPNAPADPLRHLRLNHLERLYSDFLGDGAGGLNNMTLVNIHMILRRA